MLVLVGVVAALGLSMPQVVLAQPACDQRTPECPLIDHFNRPDSTTVDCGWNEHNEGSFPGSIAVVDDSVQLLGNRRALGRRADTTGLCDLVLSYRYRSVEFGEGAPDENFLVVEFQRTEFDPISDPWWVLAKHVLGPPQGDNDGWIYVELPLPPGAWDHDSIRIQFRIDLGCCYDETGTVPGAQIDDVEICGVPCCHSDAACAPTYNACLTSDCDCAKADPPDEFGTCDKPDNPEDGGWDGRCSPPQEIPGCVACGPTDLVIMLDATGSMNTCSIEQERRAAFALVDTLADCKSLFCGISHCVAVGYVGGPDSSTAEGAYIVLGLTPLDSEANVELVKDAIEDALDPFTGLTNLEDGIEVARRELEEHGTKPFRSIVLMSDGEPTASDYLAENMAEGDLPHLGDDRLAALQAADKAKAAFIEIFTVAVKADSAAEYGNRVFLAQMATQPSDDSTGMDGVTDAEAEAENTDGDHFFIATCTCEGTVIGEEIGEAIHANLCPVDLAVTKTDTPDPVIAGQELFYDVTVSNLGTGGPVGEAIACPLLVDFLPEDVIFLGMDNTVPPCNYCEYIPELHAVFCYFFEMRGGESASVRIKVLVKPGAVAETDCGTGVITNTAFVYDTLDCPGRPGDPNLENNVTFVDTLVEESADLTIVKVSKPDEQVLAGEDFVYTIIVENLGPSVARNVAIRDTLLASGPIELVDLWSSRGFSHTVLDDPSDGNGQVEFYLDDPLEVKGANGSGQWVIRVTLRSTETQDINNLAQVFTYTLDTCPGTPDPDTGNNEAADSISILDTSNLKLTKSARGQQGCGIVEGGPDVTAGLNAYYVLTVCNQVVPPGEPGGSVATNVTVQDFLPEGVELISVVPDAGNCLPGTPGDPTDPLTCNLGTLDPNDCLDVQITVRLDPDYVLTHDVDELFNGAYAYSDNIDPDASDNYDSTSLLVDAWADVWVNKNDIPNQVVAGEVLTYVLEVGNHGPSTAEQVFLYDRLPGDFTDPNDVVPYADFVDAVVLGGDGDEVCTYGAGAHTVACSLGDLEPNEERTIKIDVRVHQDAPDPIANRYNVESSTSECNPENNAGQEATSVRREADLYVIKTDSPDPVIAGEELIYEVTVVNAGPSDATGVTLADTLDLNDVVFLAESCSEEGSPPDCPTMDTPFDLPAGASRSFKVIVRVNADAVVDTPYGKKTIENTVEVSSESYDPNPDNDRITIGTFVNDKADLTILKLSKPDEQVLAGQYFEYTILVENLGPSYARGVTVYDDIITSGAFDPNNIEVYLDPDRCDSYVTPLAIDPLTLELNEPLEPVGVGGNGRWTIKIRARATETQDVNNIARVFTTAREFHDPDGAEPADPCDGQDWTWGDGTFDPDESNNQVEDFISILDTSDLLLEKSAVGWVIEGCGYEDGLCGCDPNQVENAVTAGLQLAYTLTVTNQSVGDGEPGGSVATNVIVEDFLPADVELVSVTPSAGNCVPGTPGDAGDPLTCNVGALAVDESATVQIVVVVAPDYVLTHDADLLQNGAFTYSDNIDADTSDNYASNTTEVNAVADVSVFKWGAPLPNVVAGEPLSYFLTIHNDGPSTADQVGLVDALPADVSFVSAVVQAGSGAEECTYSAGSHTVECVMGDMQPGEEKLVYIEVLVDSDAGGCLVNDVLVPRVLGTPDCDWSNNGFEWPTWVEYEADLSVTKTATPDPVVAGTNLIYEITVTNNGPSDADTDVFLVDDLPYHVEYVSDDGGCSESGGNVECILGPLAAGESRTVRITGNVDADAVADYPLGGKTIYNQAEVCIGPCQSPLGGDGVYDPDLSNNEVEIGTFVTELADLSIVKVSKPDEVVLAGEEFTYTVIVENLGPSSARAVQITDDVIAEDEFTIIEVLLDEDRDDDYCIGGVAPFQTIEAELLEPLEPVGVGGTGRWVIQVTVVANETQDIDNIARVFTDPDEIDCGFRGFVWESGTPDPDLSNNQVQDFIHVEDVADLELTKEDYDVKLGELQEPVDPGEQFVYRLEVTNHGPSTATNVVVEDQMPGGVIVLDVSPSQGNCVTGTPGDPTDPLTCNLGTLDPNDVAYVEILVEVKPGNLDGILHNNARTYSDEFDTDNSNNIATEDTLVNIGLADLTIFKFGKPDDVVPAGEDLTFTIIVDNLGPDESEGVAIEDLFLSDGEFELVSVESDRDASCTPSPGTFDQRLELRCELEYPLEPVDASVPGSGRWTVTIVVRADEGLSINNEVCVRSETVDPDLSGNCAQTSHEVTEVADLSLTKTDSPDPVAEGALLTYELTVANAGPSTADNVVVKDVLPDRVTLVSVVATQGSCVAGEPGDPFDPTTCNIGTLADGDDATMTIVVRVKHECNFDPLFNDARTYSDFFDPNNGDNIASSVTQVVDGTDPVITCPAPITITVPPGTLSVPASNSAIQAFLNGASATDDCDPSPDITHNGPADYPLGTTDVTFVATDDFGNTDDCTSSVTVVSGQAQTQPSGQPQPSTQPSGGQVVPSFGCGLGLVDMMLFSFFGLVALRVQSRRLRRRR